MEKDKLHQLFEQHLKDLTRPHQTRDDLIYDVVAAYMYHLMEIGNMPHFVMDAVETDLKEETLEIYRKKTYGYLSLQEYRDLRIKKCC